MLTSDKRCFKTDVLVEIKNAKRKQSEMTWFFEN